MSINYGDICRYNFPPLPPTRGMATDLAGLVRELRIMQRRYKRTRSDVIKGEALRLAALVDRELGLLPWE